MKFCCLNNRSIYWKRERKKIVRWQRPYLYTRECLLSLLLLHLIESIVFPLSLSLLSYYHARLAYSRVCLFNVSLRFDPPMVMMNNSAGDNICLMYQLEQYWKNSIYHNKLSIKFYWLAISIREEISTFIKRSTSLTRQREKNDRRIVFSLDINENYLWWSLNYAWRSRRLRIWINWNLHDEVYCKMIQQRVQC